MRITKLDLRSSIKRLNAFSKRKYILNGAYGGWQLQVLVKPDCGAVDNVTYGYVPKSQLYDIIHAIIRYVETESKEEE